MKFVNKGFEQSKLIERDNKHFYKTPGGMEYPSVTTMLKATEDPAKAEGLARFHEKPEADYIMREAQLIGTQTHKMIENYLQGIASNRTEFRLLSTAHFVNIKPLLDEYVDNIHGVELKMYSDKMRLGGMADCVAEYDGVMSVIDYKTKRSNQKIEWLFDYFVQATAYSKMFEELTDVPVPQAVILVSSEKDQIEPFVVNTVDYFNALDERLNRFYNT